MSEKRYYIVQELQEILGVSRPSIYELLKKEILLNFGRREVSYFKKSFDEWLNPQTEE